MGQEHGRVAVLDARLNGPTFMVWIRARLASYCATGSLWGQRYYYKRKYIVLHWAGIRSAIFIQKLTTPGRLRATWAGDADVYATIKAPSIVDPREEHACQVVAEHCNQARQCRCG